MKTCIYTCIGILMFFLQSCGVKHNVILSCDETNDLYIALRTSKINSIRYKTPGEAIEKAPLGSAVLILADGYPEKTTILEKSLYEKAKEKQLRLYVEYPSYIPGYESLETKGTHWERAVVSSDAFLPYLEPLRILAIHDCKYIPIKMENPDIVVARIAGFDKAVYGLPEQTFPVLGELALGEGEGKLILSTTKLSQFITARYAPSDAWTAIWENILSRLLPDGHLPQIEWTPDVRPNYAVNEVLPKRAEIQVLEKGIDWFFKSNILVDSSMLEVYNKPTDIPGKISENWPFGDRINSKPDTKNYKADGSLGILEGFDSRIFHDGTQAVRWWRRGDCNGEIAGAMAIAGKLLNNGKYTQTASNIADWLFFESVISNGDRNNPNHPAYGLFGWTDVPQYVGPGSMDCYEVFYGDDEARLMLGMILAGAALDTDRFDDRLLKGLLSNLRLTGKHGFQPERFHQADLVANGWQHFNTSEIIHYSGNFQSYMWACYLWAYQQTGYKLFLDKAKKGIQTMMSGYPQQWGVTGMQMDRSRMILPLAWLIRVEDTAEHRSWLRKIYDDMDQDSDTGAIPERTEEKNSQFGKGHYKLPKSNEEYGMTESPIIQEDGDSCSDLLYAVNFAFIGLHEAYKATGDETYRVAADKLADYLCRIQIKSEKYPHLDGGWFRAFDYKRWEYWASSGDAGWGAWCIEGGWSQSWITITLALRQLDQSFWEITSNSHIKNHMENIEKQLPQQ